LTQTATLSGRALEPYHLSERQLFVAGIAFDFVSVMYSFTVNYPEYRDAGLALIYARLGQF